VTVTEIRRYPRVIWKWLWLIIVCTVIAGAVAYVLSSRIEPVYRATATVVVQATTSPIPGYDYSQPAVVAHAELMRKESVMEQVITSLGLPYSTAALRAKTSIQTSTNSPLIKVSAEDIDALTAQQIANTTVDVYIQQNRETVQAAAQEFLSQIQNEISKTSARIDELEAKQGTVGLTPEEADELKGLQDDLESLKAQRTLWYTDLAASMAAERVSMGAVASLPTSPVSPNTRQSVALACMLGLVVSTGGVFLKEYLDRSVRTAEDISVLTGLSTLGAIPKFKTGPDQKGGLITAAHPRSSVAEAFRMLRTSLQFATMDKPAKTLMITSPGPAEGKTCVMVNLAVILAQTGKMVIAVDTDLRHSTVHEIFDLSKDLGFSNLLLAQHPDVAGYLLANKVEGLKVLAAGPSPPSAADLLGSSRVPFLIEKLKKEADIILFDSPPVLAVADAAILAQKVDGVILVVDASHTRPEALVETASILSKGNARILGVVLNRVERGVSGPYYHYRNSDYYGEGDGEGGKQGEHKRSPGTRNLRGILKRFTRRTK
jgi:capsular exopolysaccharide synthesis family protein